MKSLIKVGIGVVLFALLVSLSLATVFVVSMVSLSNHDTFAQQEESDSSRAQIIQETINAQKAPEVVPPPESQLTPEEKKTVTPKGGWSEKLTGKEIQNIQIEVKTEEELKFVQDMGLNCCTDLGTCECQVTLEELNQIKARGISFRRQGGEELQKQRLLATTRWVDSLTLGPNEVLMASIQVNTEKDLEFLRRIGVYCCIAMGGCKCQVTKEQVKQIAAYGFEFGARVQDTSQWGKETKPKSDKVIPPKPKPKPEPDKSQDESQMDTTEIFHLKVKIKTEEEEEIIQRIGLCRGKKGREVCSCHATSEQVEELKKEGIEFEIRGSAKRFGK
jgi:hypothetical protein